MMLLSICLVSCLPQVATLQAGDAQGLEWVADLPGTPSQFLIPLSATSDRVVRVVPGVRGLELMIAAPLQTGFRVKSMGVTALGHRHAERVLLLDGQPFLVRDERLPADVRGLDDDASWLALLARQDQAGLQSSSLRVEAAPQGFDLLLLPLESELGQASIEVRPAGGSWRSMSWLQGQGHALRLPGRQTWELRAAAVGLDQLSYGRVEPLDGPGLPLTLLQQRHVTLTKRSERARAGRGPSHTIVEPAERGTNPGRPDQPAGGRCGAGELLQFIYASPSPDSNTETWTLLVEIELEADGQPAAPLPPTSGTTAPLWRDVSAESGILDVHFEGPREQLDIRPTMGPGAAWGDFDGDGLVDLYVLQGAGRAGSARPANRLMRNLGQGRFQQVPGAGDNGAGMGALFFDLEGDGDLDLYVANYGADVLYRNDGAGGFEDVSDQHDLARSSWSAGLAAADYDNDGDLDLYVSSYLVYDPQLMPPVEDLPGYAREDPIEMLPFAFPGAPNTFLENVEGKLVDRTAELGLANEQGRGMQPVFWDFDLDGDQDLYVANDVSMNVLFRNEGDGTFKDISFQVGMDDPRGGMGVATGDVDFDGDLDLFLTNWQLDANALYRNNLISRSARKSHRGTFQDITVHSHLGSSSVGKTSWGGVLFDADNDGDLDLFVPNGYTSPDYESTGICVGQSNQFFLNDGTGRFEDVSSRAGPALSAALASRSAALCDYDRDGRLDLFVTNNNGPYQLLHNEIRSKAHWIGVELRGRGANTAAIGARAMLEVDGLQLVRHVSAGGGYLAGHDPGLHFGLGDVQHVGPLLVHWPSGQISSHELAEVDRWITIEQPAAENK